MAEQLSLTNLHFLPLQPAEKFNAFLNMADVHLIIQKKGAGDVVMPSKLNSILAAGGLVLATCEKDTALFDLITNNEIGLTAEPENNDALKEKIVFALNNSEQLQSIKKYARLYAEQHLSKEKVINKYYQTAINPYPMNH